MVRSTLDHDRMSLVLSLSHTFSDLGFHDFFLPIFYSRIFKKVGKLVWKRYSVPGHWPSTSPCSQLNQANQQLDSWTSDSTISHARSILIHMVPPIFVDVLHSLTRLLCSYRAAYVQVTNIVIMQLPGFICYSYPHGNYIVISLLILKLLGCSCQSYHATHVEVIRLLML